MQPTVYLAGPISGLNYNGCTSWREYAIRELGQHGIKGWSPMRAKEYLAKLETISGHGNEYKHMGVFASSRGVMTRDRFDCMRCDIVLVNFLGATSVSIGTCMEIAWADARRTPIICAIEPGRDINVSAEHRAWLAALIDGEGCIAISRVKHRSGRVGYNPQIRVKMTHEGVVREAARRAGVGSVGGPYHQNVAGRKPFWVWSVVGQQCTDLLCDLYPHLIIKRDKAVLAVAMNATAGGGGPGTVTPDKQHIRDDIYERFQSNDSSGIKAPEMLSSPLEHMMINEAIGLRVETLDEAIRVAAATLVAA